MSQPWAKSFYSSKAWRDTRAYILHRDHFTCQCHQLLGGKPCGLMAEEVHHIEELTPENIHDPRIALHEANLISLAYEHHRLVHRGGKDSTQVVAAGYTFDAAGRVVPL